jgi:hypothetical protein
LSPIAAPFFSPPPPIQEILYHPIQDLSSTRGLGKKIREDRNFIGMGIIKGKGSKKQLK